MVFFSVLLRQCWMRMGLLACLLWLSLPVVAEEPLSSSVAFVVVVRADSPIAALSQDEVRDLFLGHGLPRLGMLPNPLDIQDKSIRAAFYRKLIGWSINRWRAYWARQVFAGLERAPTLVEVSEAVAEVLRSPWAVAYLPARHLLPTQVRVVFELP